MKTKLIKVTLCLLIVFWIVLIFVLSSQNGTQTNQISGKIAEKAAEIIYHQPTEQQIEKLHVVIRKAAHISLFFVLGVLSFSIAYATLDVKSTKRKVLLVSSSFFITCSCGFFDEWHKQFIEGRHFQLDEALLNMLSGAIGIVVAIVFIIWFNRIRKIS